MPILFIFKWRASSLFSVSLSVYLYFFCKSQFALIEDKDKANDNNNNSRPQEEQRPRFSIASVISLTWILNAFLILLEFMKNLAKQITVTLQYKNMWPTFAHIRFNWEYYETWFYIDPCTTIISSVWIGFGLHAVLVAAWMWQNALAGTGTANLHNSWHG